MRERHAHVVGLCRRECRQQARARFDQHDACRARIDVTEVGGQSLLRDLCDRAGHFNAGGAAAYDDEGKQTPLLRGVGDQLGLLEGDQNTAADAGRVLDALEARRIGRPFVMAEIGVHGAGRDHQIIVGHVAEIGVQQLFLHIHAADVLHQHRRVALLAQDMPDRPGHVGGRKRRRRHLVEQRLEAVMVLAVDQDDVGGRTPQRLGRLQPAKAGAYDHHPGNAFRHSCPSIVHAQCRPMGAQLPSVW